MSTVPFGAGNPGIMDGIYTQARGCYAGIVSVFPVHDLQGLLTVFTFSKKADLEKYCRDLVIHGSDFANVILACDGVKLPFQHQIYYTDKVPEHLTPNETWGAALSANGVGLLNPAAKKVVNKIGSLFEQRRWLVGHMFYTANLYEWHVSSSK